MRIPLASIANFGKVTTVTQNFMRFLTFGFKVNF